ncbi:MAG TPA: penicillin-binding protein activator [Alphaproteobacteria bacterium]|nr:penicillin-binding protein activator [Alphaproteobacteria bacterium]
MARLSAVFGSASRNGPWAAMRHAALALGAVLWLGACTPATVPDGPSATQGPGASGIALGPLQSAQTDRFGRPVADDVIRVGLLLPLSGRGSDIGPAMRNAAEMALFDAGVENFELLPRDTGGTAEGAAAAAQSALVDGARLIIGPLFADDVPAVRSVAESAGVNVISFTSDRTMAGGNVLVMGFLPSSQVERVVDYAVQRGMTRYAVLAPETAYGRIVADALQGATRERGAQLTGVQFFDPNAPDYSEAVRAIASGGASYDAIMLPEGGLRLRAIAPLLPFYELQDVQVLGTGLWDEPDIGREPALVGGWFASPQPELRADFERRYQENFGAAPPRLATLAYDAVALAAVLARSPFGSTYDWPVLTDPSGFIGLDGVFRFEPTGEVQRGLAVLEVTPQGPVVVDPAPQTFVGQVF